MKLPPDGAMRADLHRLLDRSGEPPTDRILDALTAHLRLLGAWNRRYKLTTIEAWPDILDRHVWESLLPLRWIAPCGTLLDVGSGNGYPAIPILACRPGLQGVLVERSEKKALFLDAVVREAGMAHTPGGGLAGAREVIRGHSEPTEEPESGMTEAQPRVRIETRDLAKRAPDEALPRFDHVISRATLAPARFLELAESWAAPGGRVFLYAGSDATPAVDAMCARGWRSLGRLAIGGREDSHLFAIEASGPT